MSKGKLHHKKLLDFHSLIINKSYNVQGEGTSQETFGFPFIDYK